MFVRSVINYTLVSFIYCRRRYIVYPLSNTLTNPKPQNGTEIQSSTTQVAPRIALALQNRAWDMGRRWTRVAWVISVRAINNCFISVTRTPSFKIGGLKEKIQQQFCWILRNSYSQNSPYFIGVNLHISSSIVIENLYQKLESGKTDYTKY